ncbi:MAG: prolipoprotein diacylglyceryl transferase [Hyphomicrobiaceae bacterium]
MTLLAITYPAIDPIALQLGPISIKWYGLAYVAGLLLGWTYLKHLIGNGRLWPAGRAPLTVAQADDLFLYVALGVILGGRIGNVLLYDIGYYAQHPLEILQIWKGGMAFHGGLVGTIIAMWLFARAKGVNPLTVMDLVSASVPFGLFFGRIANFINAEVVGTESTVPWAMVFPYAGPDPRHPAQLYEAALEGIVLFLILRWLTHRRGALGRPGVVGASFLVGYGSLRAVAEMFKHDEYRAILGSLPITSGMAYCIPMVVIGLGFLWWRRKTQTA